MAIVEILKIEDFNSWLASVDPKRYKLIFTERSEIILRPSVSTRPLDTIIISNASQNDLQKVEKSWSGSVLRCKRIYWDEEKFLRKREDE